MQLAIFRLKVLNNQLLNVQENTVLKFGPGNSKWEMLTAPTLPLSSPHPQHCHPDCLSTSAVQRLRVQALLPGSTRRFPEQRVQKVFVFIRLCEFLHLKTYNNLCMVQYYLNTQRVFWIEIQKCPQILGSIAMEQSFCILCDYMSLWLV